MDAAAAGERTRGLWKLNEHGPELNVFWIPKFGVGRGRAIVVRSLSRSASNKEKEDFGNARTRWVTERIAATRRNGPESKRRNDGFELFSKSNLQNSRKTQRKEKLGTAIFYHLTNRPNG